MGSKGGNGPFQFGLYELWKTLHLNVLLFAILSATVTWGLEQLPALSELGGYWPLVVAAVVPVLRAVQQWLIDNRGGN